MGAVQRARRNHARSIRSLRMRSFRAVAVASASSTLDPATLPNAVVFEPYSGGRSGVYNEASSGSGSTPTTAGGNVGRITQVGGVLVASNVSGGPIYHANGLEFPNDTALTLSTPQTLSPGDTAFTIFHRFTRAAATAISLLGNIIGSDNEILSNITADGTLQFKSNSSVPLEVDAVIASGTKTLILTGPGDGSVMGYWTGNAAGTQLATVGYFGGENFTIANIGPVDNGADSRISVVAPIPGYYVASAAIAAQLAAFYGDTL